VAAAVMLPECQRIQPQVCLRSLWALLS
jgi:hypothetical protein